MKQVKKTRTRRRRALLRLTVIVPALVLTAVLRGYSFTPEGALRESEDFAATGPTQIVAELGRLPFGTRAQRARLSAHENATMLSVAEFSWKAGWGNSGVLALDCSGEEPIYIGQCQMLEMPDQERGLLYFFGRVDDAGLQAVTLQRQAVEDGTKSLLWETSVPREKWVAKNGKWYFTVSCPYEAGKEEDAVLTVWTVDSEGERRERAFQNMSVMGLF